MKKERVLSAMQYGARYEEPTGRAVLTKGYNLPADYVIHTVGPIVGGSLNQKLKDDRSSRYSTQTVISTHILH